VIESFRDKETKKIWEEIYSRQFPKDIQRIGLRKLVLIHRAKDITDLRVPPGNRLEQLTGDSDMERIPSITPGEILLEEFLKPMDITPYRLAKDTHVPATRISQILKGNRKITADTALRFSKYFGNSADFWLGIQDEYDLREEKKKIANELEKIPRVKVS
jgi:addiction module HigA family antidote